MWGFQHILNSLIVSNGTSRCFPVGWIMPSFICGKEIKIWGLYQLSFMCYSCWVAMDCIPRLVSHDLVPLKTVGLNHDWENVEHNPTKLRLWCCCLFTEIWILMYRNGFLISHLKTNKLWGKMSETFSYLNGKQKKPTRIVRITWSLFSYMFAYPHIFKCWYYMQLVTRI